MKGTLLARRPAGFPRAVSVGMLLLAACHGASSEAPPSGQQTADTAVRPTGIIDSLLPVEEELRRFRVATPESIDRFQGGAPSREGLVRSYVRAIETSDNPALHRLLINRAEYAWLVYPESELTRPPYVQKPGLAWFLMQNASDRGITRVLNRHGGRPLGFRSFACEEEPAVQGSNRIWRECRVRFAPAEGAGGVVERKLFGGIIGRSGTYKFLTYATDY